MNSLIPIDLRLILSKQKKQFVSDNHLIIVSKILLVFQMHFFSRILSILSMNHEFSNAFRDYDTKLVCKYLFLTELITHTWYLCKVWIQSGLAGHVQQIWVSGLVLSGHSDAQPGRALSNSILVALSLLSTAFYIFNQSQCAAWMCWIVIVETTHTCTL